MPTTRSDEVGEVEAPPSDVDIDLTLPAEDTVAAATERNRLRSVVLLGLLVLSVLNAADLLTTRAVLGYTGVLEANPLARVLLSYYRVDAVKACVLVALVWMAFRSRPTVLWACCIWFACGYYTLAVISNVLLLASLP